MRPLDCKEIKPISSKGNEPWIFIGRTDAETEAPILWPSDGKNWLIGKDPDAGKDWRQEEKGMTEDAMVRWHHWLNGHEFEQTLGDSEGQGSLVCCSPWGLKESDTTEQLNRTELMLKLKLQYSGLLMRRANTLEKTPMLGKTEGKRRGRQRLRWLESIMIQWTWAWFNSARY